MFAVHYQLHDHATASMLSEVFATPGKAHAALAAHLVDLGECAGSHDKVLSKLGPEGSSIAREVSFCRPGYGEYCSATIVEVTLRSEAPQEPATTVVMSADQIRAALREQLSIIPAYPEDDTDEDVFRDYDDSLNIALEDLRDLCREIVATD